MIRYPDRNRVLITVQRADGWALNSLPQMIQISSATPVATHCGCGQSRRRRAGVASSRTLRGYGVARREHLHCARPCHAPCGSCPPRRSDPTRTSGSSIYLAVQNMLLAARALGLGATLTTLYLQFEKEAETAFGLPPGVHSYALLPIGYPMGRFGPVRRVPLADVVFENRWGQTCSFL